MRIAKTIILALTVLTLSTMQAQESAFVANHQKMALLPGNMSNVSIVDGNLYCYASDVLLVAYRKGEQLLGFSADTQFVHLAEGVDYVVRQPSTGDLYFTQRNKRGQSFLYFYNKPDGKKGKVKRVRLGGMTVEHPTFTVDGRIMIFSSRDNHLSFGGYDLWYSVYNDGHWSRPHNLGNRINTQYDEVTPAIYRDCLLFSSNGHSDNHAYLDIYSSRLISSSLNGDTVGISQIGRSRVQKLPAPINSSYADDFDLAIDTTSNYGYWVSKRVESDSDSQLYSFSGNLEGLLLWGRIVDKYDAPLPSVRVAASQNGLDVCSAVTDSDGYYRLYLQSDQYYDIAFRYPGYFVSYEVVNTAKSPDEFLIAEQRLDVTLERLLLGQRIYYSDLFGPNVDIKLSDHGRRQLEPLVRFLVDNPDLQADLSLSNDITDDQHFNQLLTDQRIASLQDYLFSLVPHTVKLRFSNACAGQSGCSSASGQSRLTVILNHPSVK